VLEAWTPGCYDREVVEPSGDPEVTGGSVRTGLFL
jgi:hypothetical protein